MEQVALVLFDRFDEEMVVKLCENRSVAEDELTNWYRKELVNADFVKHESTYITEDKAVVDEIFKIKEARIAYIKRKNEV